MLTTQSEYTLEEALIAQFKGILNHLNTGNVFERAKVLRDKFALSVLPTPGAKGRLHQDELEAMVLAQELSAEGVETRKIASLRYD